MTTPVDKLWLRHQNLLADLNSLMATVQDAQAWLQAKGPKKTWSAHDRLLDITRFDTLKSALDGYLQTLFAQTPAAKAMGLTTYGFSVHRSLDKLRFCGNKGRSQGGTTLPLDPAYMAYFTGFFLGAFLGARHKSREDKQRLSCYGLPDVAAFSIHEPEMRRYKEASANGPRSAVAKLILQGDLLAFAPHTTSHQSQQTAFLAGAQHAYDAVVNATWSAGPALWQQCYKHATYKKQHGAGGTYNPYAPPWQHVERAWDDQAAAAVSLLQDTTPTKRQHFVVLMGNKPHHIIAFCAKSALAFFLLDTLPQHNKKTGLDLENLRVFPVTADAAAPLMPSLKTFFQDTPHA